jgi:hypothetical protein
LQVWLGQESLATTQKYLEPSKETEKQLEANSGLPPAAIIPATFPSAALMATALLISSFSVTHFYL